jgi:hypothetical protein
MFMLFLISREFDPKIFARKVINMNKMNDDFSRAANYDPWCFYAAIEERARQVGWPKTLREISNNLAKFTLIGLGVGTLASWATNQQTGYVPEMLFASAGLVIGAAMFHNSVIPPSFPDETIPVDPEP